MTASALLPFLHTPCDLSPQQMAAAAARRAQGILAAVVRTPLTREISMAATKGGLTREISMAATKGGSWTAAGRPSLKVWATTCTAAGRPSLKSRWMSSVPEKPTPEKPIPTPECSNSAVKDLQNKLADVEKKVLVLQVKLRHTQAAYWSSFFAFTTVLTVLPAWVYYIQLDSATTKEDVKTLRTCVEKLEGEKASKVSKLEVEVKFPHDN